MGVGVGEGMDGTAVFDELPVGVGVGHFFLKGGDFGGRNVGIVGAVECENFATDCFGRERCIEAAVEADDAGNVGAAAGEFEDGGAAETVADGGNAFGVDVGVLFEGVERGGDAGAEEGTVGFVFTGLGAGFLGVLWSDPLAVDVNGEGDVAEFGEFVGFGFGKFSGPHPVVDDEDAGVLAGGGAGQVTFAGDGAGRVVEAAGVGERREDE